MIYKGVPLLTYSSFSSTINHFISFTLTTSIPINHQSTTTMSYYTNPYLAQLAQLGQQRRYPSQPSPSPYGYGNPQSHTFATPQFNFYPSPSPAPAHDADDYSLEDEERAAIAHLRAIQRRKQLEQINRQEIEREATLAKQYRERELAQREREIALARAMREREVALAYAKAQREREIELARRAREVELARFAEIQNHRRQAEIERQQAIHERQQAINEHRRRQCARHCARRQEVSTPAPTPTKAEGASDSQADLDAFNKWIGSLFGLQLPTDDTPAPEEKKATTPVEKKDTAPTAQVEKPAPVVESTPVAKPTTAATTAEEKKPEFPESINNLLSTFLGLRVDPESKLGEAVSNQVNKVPEGLNEFLNQFGLEFFPDQAEEKKDVVEKKEEAGPSTAPAPATSSSTPTPAPGPTPAPAPSSSAQPQSRGPIDLAEYLSGSHGLPPFVRDILGNVELAFKERSQEKSEGKGKGVAEGEKKAVPTPAPAPAPTSTPAPVDTTPAPAPVASTAETEVEVDNSKAISDSMSALANIESELVLAKSQFTFPTTLSFGPQTTDSSPSLLFNKTNKPYHAQNNRLLQLLLQADGVASNGDREVRRRRKNVVKAVEGEIEKLERKRDDYWAEVKERRDTTGEVSEGESWCTGSTSEHDHENENEEVVHVEDVAEEAPASADKPEPTPAEAAESVETVEAEKPSTFAEAVKTTSDEPKVDEKKESQVDEKKEPEVQVQENKEEGYELL